MIHIYGFGKAYIFFTLKVSLAIRILQDMGSLD